MGDARASSPGTPPSGAGRDPRALGASDARPLPPASGQSLVRHLHQLSGQEKEPNPVELDHGYAKPWNRHPDASIRSRPAKFLFMQHFPRHFLRREEPEVRVDLDSAEGSEPFAQAVNPFLAEASNLTPKTPTTPPAVLLAQAADQSSHSCPDVLPPNKTNWTPAMHKLWAKATKILQADRLGRLTCEGSPNELILKRNLVEKAAHRLRHLFASVATWESGLLSWFHSTLQEHLMAPFLVGYHEAMQCLRLKVSF